MYSSKSRIRHVAKINGRVHPTSKMNLDYTLIAMGAVTLIRSSLLQEQACTILTMILGDRLGEFVDDADLRLSRRPTFCKM